MIAPPWLRLNGPLASVCFRGGNRGGLVRGVAVTDWLVVELSTRYSNSHIAAAVTELKR
jgi:hypothetical protein